MKKTLYFIALLIAATFTFSAFTSHVHAAPFVVSDPTLQIVTHCGIYLDAKPVVDVAVATSPLGSSCRFDLAGTVPGAHRILASFVNVDPLWGRVESANKSNPLDLSVPGAIVAPGGLKIIP